MTTVLLVDDSRVTRSVIRVFLVGRDVKVIEACDGYEALRLMHEHHPDLVITDLEMPELDGLGLCKKIRGDVRLRNTPFLVLSGTLTPELSQRCRAAGAHDVLAKPIQPKALLAAVEACLPSFAKAPVLHA
jgi:two-component system chemotaxis response regulator CheY